MVLVFEWAGQWEETKCPGDTCLLIASKRRQHVTAGKKQTAHRRAKDVGTAEYPNRKESVDSYFNFCNKIPVVSKV